MASSRVRRDKIYFSEQRSANVGGELGRRQMGPPPARNLGFPWGPPAFQTPAKASGLAYDANGRCEALGIFGPIKVLGGNMSATAVCV